MSGAPLNTKDLRDFMRFERNRQHEIERKKRIFDVKKGLFGFDVNEYPKQVAQNKKKRMDELERKRLYEEQEELIHNIIKEQEEIEEKQKKLNLKNDQHYHCLSQRREQRREYDIDNRREFQENTLDPTRWGVSSIQAFEGEDQLYRSYRYKQQAQQRAWLDQQVDERQKAIELRKLNEKKMQELADLHEEKLNEKYLAIEKTRQSIQKETVEYNKSLAADKAAERARTKQQEKEDNEVELCNMMNSDILTEKFPVERSHSHLLKILPKMYRGKSAAEIKKFRQEQYHVYLDHKKRKEEQKLAEAQFGQYKMNMVNSLQWKDLEMKRQEREIFENHLRDNAELIKEQKNRETAVARNVISESYYDQFNKSSR